MNIRSDENIFLAETSVPATESQDAATSMKETSDREAEGYSSERFLLCSKSKHMIEKVRRSFAGQNDVVIDVADQTLAQMAESELDVLADHCLVAVEVDPEDPAEMAALRTVIGKSPAHIQFLAITPNELTISTARDLLEAGVLEVLPMMALRDIESTPAGNHNGPDAASSQKGMVVAIAQTRGGIGATTLAINLASLLSAPKSCRDKTSRPRVALLDLDFQNGDAAAALDIDDNGALIEMLKTGGTPDAEFVKHAMVPYKDQFDVLPTPLEFAPFDAFKPEKMALMIAELRTKYDYVILGLPRSMVLWIEPILACADQMLLVTDTSVTGTRQARRLIDFYTEDNPSIPLEIIISKEKKPLSQPKAVKEAANFLDKSFDIWLPYDGRAAGKAADRGEPMIEVAKRSAVAKPLKKIVAMLQVIQVSGKRREI
ncbi:MAG: AAA family ATPase [Sulfitobacter sp.]